MAGGKISWSQRAEIIRYHKDQLKADPLHKQSDTLRYFEPRFRVPKSTFTRWLKEDLSYEHPSDPDASQRISVEPREISEEVSDHTNAIDPGIGPEPKMSTIPKTHTSITHNEIPISERIVSAVIQYYTHMKLDDPTTPLEISKPFIKKFLRTIKRSYPEVSVKKKSRILKKLNGIEAIESAIQHQFQISQSCNNLAKETYRLRKLFESYNHEDIFHYVEFTIDLSHLLRLCIPSWTIDNLRISVGYGVNFNCTVFLKPVVVTNFSLPSYKSQKTSITWYNETGLISNCIFSHYLSVVSDQFKESKLLFAMDKSSSHFPGSEFHNIKLTYTNLENFPLSYGLNNLIMKNCQLSIIIFLAKESKPGENPDLNFVPSMVKSTLNEVFHKCRCDFDYIRFIKHGVKLCLNPEMRTNLTKYLRVNLYKGISRSKEGSFYILDSNQQVIDKKLTQLGKKSFLYELGNPFAFVYDLESLIKSNLSCRVSVNDDNSEIIQNFHQLFNLRGMLEASEIIEPYTFELFDRFYNSLTNDVLQIDEPRHESNMVEVQETLVKQEPASERSDLARRELPDESHLQIQLPDESQMQDGSQFPDETESNESQVDDSQLQDQTPQSQSLDQLKNIVQAPSQLQSENEAYEDANTDVESSTIPSRQIPKSRNGSQPPSSLRLNSVSANSSGTKSKFYDSDDSSDESMNMDLIKRQKLGNESHTSSSIYKFNLSKHRPERNFSSSQILKEFDSPQEASSLDHSKGSSDVKDSLVISQVDPKDSHSKESKANSNHSPAHSSSQHSNSQHSKESQPNSNSQYSSLSMTSPKKNGTKPQPIQIPSSFPQSTVQVQSSPQKSSSDDESFNYPTKSPGKSERDEIEQELDRMEARDEEYDSDE